MLSDKTGGNKQTVTFLAFTKCLPYFTAHLKGNLMGQKDDLDITHWFVDPEDVSAVCQGLVWPKVCHGLGLNPWALFPLQHAGARRAIQRVDLTGRSGRQSTPWPKPNEEEENTLAASKSGQCNTTTLLFANNKYLATISSVLQHFLL